MNGCQRISAALQGEWPDRTPVMLHNFMMAAREAGVTMSRFRSEPRETARAFIESVEKYGYDGVLLDIDTVTLAGAAGVPVDLPEDLPARCREPRLHSLEDVDDLEPPDIARYRGVQVWLEAATLLKKHFGDEVFVRGNCDQCPFSLASAMRSIEAWMLDVADPANEERVHRLLAYCEQATAQFLRLMGATGVHMVSNGDSVSGPELVSPRIYRKYALPYEKRIAAAAREVGLPYALHICGKTNLILEDMVSTGADALELDYRTDVELARAKMDGRVTFIGNIDPSGVLALGTTEMVEEASRALLRVFATTPRFILNAGCAIPATTPPENIHALVRVAHAAPPIRSRSEP
jgi:MtaA/CmuA family methyltransferase